MKEIFSLITITVTYIFIYVFIRNNYFKFAAKVLDFTFIIINLGVVYVFFSNFYISESVMGYILAITLVYNVYYFIEKRRIRYLKNIYHYFENFNEAIWFVNDFFIDSIDNIKKIEANIKNILNNMLKIRGNGISIISVSNKTRQIKYILLFNSISKMEEVSKGLSDLSNKKKFCIGNKGILTLECKF